MPPAVGRSAAAAAGAALLIAVGGAKKFEGLETTAYPDPGNRVPTICYGRTKDVRLGDTATPAQCEQWLTQEMREHMAIADKCIPGHVALTPGQLAAFADITYNIGPKPVCGPGSTMARLLDAGDVLGACREMPKWDKVCFAGVCRPLGGLTKRRQENLRWCLTM